MIPLSPTHTGRVTSYRTMTECKKTASAPPPRSRISVPISLCPLFSSPGLCCAVPLIVVQLTGIFQVSHEGVRACRQAELLHDLRHDVLLLRETKGKRSLDTRPTGEEKLGSICPPFRARTYVRSFRPPHTLEVAASIARQMARPSTSSSSY